MAMSPGTLKTLRHPKAPRLLLAAAAACLLGGCSSEGSDWETLFSAARGAWDDRGAAVSLNEAAAIPYATIGVRLDGGRQQIAILAMDTAGERLWASGGKVALTTRNGRIVRTAGFGTDLNSSSASSPGTDWSRVQDYTWVADFMDLRRFSVPIVCRDTPAGAEPITILGQQFDTFRVDEHCTSDQLGWSFDNTYWVSGETGRVWRAVQHIHPKGVVLEIEILRPPLGSN